MSSTLVKRFVAAALGMLAITACDPCSGVGTCNSDVLRITAEGQLVRAENGAGVDGVQIDMVHVGRGAPQQDSVSTVTSGGGFWRLTTASATAESTLVRFRISSPLLSQPYTVYRWIVPTDQKGEAYVADRWVINPYFPYIVQLFQAESGQALPNVPFRFHQTGGPRLLGLDSKGDIQLSTDGGGYGQLFLFNAFASDTGIIEGQLTAELPAPYGASTAIVDLYPSASYHPQIQFFGLALRSSSTSGAGAASVARPIGIAAP